MNSFREMKLEKFRKKNLIAFDCWKTALRVNWNSIPMGICRALDGGGVQRWCEGLNDWQVFVVWKIPLKILNFKWLKFKNVKTVKISFKIFVVWPILVFPISAFKHFKFYQYSTDQPFCRHSQTEIDTQRHVLLQTSNQFQKITWSEIMKIQ